MGSKFLPTVWVLNQMKDTDVVFGCQACETFWASEDPCFVCGKEGLSISVQTAAGSLSLLQSNR